VYRTGVGTTHSGSPGEGNEKISLIQPLHGWVVFIIFIFPVPRIREHTGLFTLNPVVPGWRPCPDPAIAGQDDGITGIWKENGWVLFQLLGVNHRLFNERLETAPPMESSEMQKARPSTGRTFMDSSNW
jgi:hypothetical protein